MTAPTAIARIDSIIERVACFGGPKRRSCSQSNGAMQRSRWKNGSAGTARKTMPICNRLYGPARAGVNHERPR
jgi:hypothetical protein